MYYIEFLRAVRALRVIGIILGIFLILGIGMRIVTLRSGSPDAWVNDFKVAPGAVVHQTRLADGSTKTVVDNASRHTHVVVLDLGNRGKKISIVEPSGHSAKGDYSVMFGNTSRMDDGKTRRIFVDTTNSINFDVSVFFGIAAFLALITATLLSCTLGKENDGHLEFTWTKPASREMYALTAIGVDIAAIVVSEIATVLVFMFLLALFPGPGTLTWLPTTTAVLLAALLAPMAWYALLTMASASLKRGIGAVIGTAWPVAVSVPGLAMAYFGESAIGQGAHQFFRAINFFNPIGYLQIHGAGHNDVPALTVQHASTAVPILAMLTILYLALAIAQWRRVEA